MSFYSTSPASYFSFFFFFFNDTATTEIYTLSLHDALPICSPYWSSAPASRCWSATSATTRADRKSTRLNSSHEWISYAAFCLKKKKNRERRAGGQLRLTTGAGRETDNQSWTASVQRQWKFYWSLNPSTADTLSMLFCG